MYRQPGYGPADFGYFSMEEDSEAYMIIEKGQFHGWHLYVAYVPIAIHENTRTGVKRRELTNSTCQ